jgi:hypothetical protein
MADTLAAYRVNRLPRAGDHSLGEHNTHRLTDCQCIYRPGPAHWAARVTRNHSDMLSRPITTKVTFGILFIAIANPDLHDKSLSIWKERTPVWPVPPVASSVPFET